MDIGQGPEDPATPTAPVRSATGRRARPAASIATTQHPSIQSVSQHRAPALFHSHTLRLSNPFKSSFAGAALRNRDEFPKRPRPQHPTEAGGDAGGRWERKRKSPGALLNALARAYPAAALGARRPPLCLAGPPIPNNQPRAGNSNSARGGGPVRLKIFGDSKHGCVCNLIGGIRRDRCE